MTSHKDTTVIVKMLHPDGPQEVVAHYVFRVPQVSQDEYAVVPYYDGDGWIVIHVGTGVSVFNNRAYKRPSDAMDYALELFSSKGKATILKRLAELPRLDNPKQVLTHSNRAQA